MIKILGAGISGLTAAINLAREGREVTVYERLPEVGKKIGTNVQLLGNWDTEEDIISHLRKFNVKVKYQTRLDKLIFYSPNLEYKAEIFAGKRPVGYNVIRGGKKSFECYLAKQAVGEGAKLITNFRKKIMPDIIATGSNMARGVAFGGIFKGKFDDKTAHVFFDYDYAPGGYIYISPHSKREATVSVAVLGGLHVNPQEAFEKTIREHKVIKEIIGDSRLIKNFSGVANFEIPETAMRFNSLLVGEAAGFQDAAFGFGMRLAIHSGYLAAKSIVERTNYDKLWRDAFLQELKKTLRLRHVLDRVDNNFLNRLIKAIGKRDIDDFARIWNSTGRLAAVYLKSLIH